MADTKISALTAASAAAGTNEIPINEDGTTKKITVTQLLAVGTNSLIHNEVPTGDINGTNAAYVLANTPVANSEQVYLNGVLQQIGPTNDYTLSTATITFNTAPLTGSIILVSYQLAAAATGNADTLDNLHATSFDQVGVNKLITAVPSSDHTASGITIQLVAHENQAFGDVCYVASDGQAQLIDADAIATMSAVVMCADSTISATATGTYLLMGIARDDTWAWTVGGLIYGTVTGTTGNTLSQTAPTATTDVVQIMGVATHADRMLFKPQLVQVEIV